MRKQIDDVRILAVDIGTSSVRAMVFDQWGTIHVRKQGFYSTLRPLPGMEEQDPLHIRQRTYDIIQEALLDDCAHSHYIKGISFSSQMYGIFPIDNEGTPLLHNILWSDSRAVEQARRYIGTEKGISLYNHTGCRPNSMFPLYKIMWIQEHRKDILPRISSYVSIKEFVLFPLIEKWVVDYSMASATGLLDIHTKEWCSEALSLADISSDELSVLNEGTVGHPLYASAITQSWNLSSDVLLFCGGGDGPLANLGSGASSVGECNIDLGTSGAARAVVDKPTIDENGSLWCFCLSEKYWVSGGIVTNVGNAYAWLCNNVANIISKKEEQDVVKELDALSAGVFPGAEGLFFLPYLRRARSPHWNDTLVGTIVGLGPDHTLGHIARALLEAITFDIASIIEIIDRQVSVNQKVVLTGGFSKNRTMGQLLADVLQRDVVVPHNSEGSISGAAIIGLVGLGVCTELSFKHKDSIDETLYTPKKELAESYKNIRSEFSHLISLLSRR